MLFGHKPSYNHLKVFGCLCFVSKMPRSKDKFVARGQKCIFLGYPPRTRGWRVYDIESGNVFVSRDVVLFKDNFPFSNTP